VSTSVQRSVFLMSTWPRYSVRVLVPFPPPGGVDEVVASGVSEHVPGLSSARRCVQPFFFARMPPAASRMAALGRRYREQVRAKPLANQTFANPAPHSARAVPVHPFALARLRMAVSERPCWRGRAGEAVLERPCWRGRAGERAP
jgi:hypothetical protein